MIEIGRYKAHPTKWGVKTAKTGNEQAVIEFEVTDDKGAKHLMSWYGSFVEGKAREITLKAIAACGCEDIAYFDTPQGLDTKKEVQVTIEQETNEKGTFSKIKWVNPIGNKFENMMPPAQSKNFLKSLKADFAATKEATGATAQKKSKSKGEDVPPPETDPDDDFNL